MPAVPTALLAPLLLALASCEGAGLDCLGRSRPTASGRTMGDWRVGEAALRLVGLGADERARRRSLALEPPRGGVDLTEGASPEDRMDGIGPGLMGHLLPGRARSGAEGAALHRATFRDADGRLHGFHLVLPQRPRWLSRDRLLARMERALEDQPTTLLRELDVLVLHDEQPHEVIDRGALLRANANSVMATVGPFRGCALVNIFPNGWLRETDSLANFVLHELGHIASERMNGSLEPGDTYLRAMSKDGNEVSHYGSQSSTEDFAEGMVLYVRSTRGEAGGPAWTADADRRPAPEGGTPYLAGDSAADPAETAARHPNRFDVLEAFLEALASQREDEFHRFHGSD